MKTTLFSLLIAGWAAVAYAGEAGRQADRAVTLKVSTEREAIHRHGPREVVVQVELEGRRPTVHHRALINLAVVLDQSGSMGGPKRQCMDWGAGWRSDLNRHSAPNN